MTPALTPTAQVARIDVRHNGTWQQFGCYTLAYAVDATSYHAALRWLRATGKQFRIVSR